MASRVGTLLVLVITALLATALPAAAHNELKSSNPAKGARLDTAPAAVVLTFSENLIVGQTTVTVTGPDGASAAASPAQISGITATVPFKPSTAGTYTVAYKVVADDGDVTDTKFTFTLTAAAIGPPTTPGLTTTPSPSTTAPTTTTTTTPPTSSAAPAQAASSSDSGTTWWPWVVGVLALILIAVVLLVVRRRTRGGAGPVGG